VANVKIFNLKSVIIFYEHLWVVELTYRKIFSFKFFFRCQQSDTVLFPGLFATGGKFAACIVDIGGAH
jgi:hypothetical protein